MTQYAGITRNARLFMNRLQRSARAVGEVRGRERLVQQERGEHEEHRGPELEVAHPREARRGPAGPVV